MSKRWSSALCSTVHECQRRPQTVELGGGGREGDGVARSGDLLKLLAGAARISAMAGEGAWSTGAFVAVGVLGSCSDACKTWLIGVKGVGCWMGGDEGSVDS